MGYEPHIPALDGQARQDTARDAAFTTYREVMSAVSKHSGMEDLSQLTFNAAGSPTFRLWTAPDLANDIAVGSALVKPTNFDTELLSPFMPASFIATPVLKTWPGVQIPGSDVTTSPVEDADTPQTIFTYGGYWKAEPVFPAGIEYNSKFGRSSNQDMLIGKPGLSIQLDDLVILRPRQSESVFLQFGPILVYDNGQIVDEWPVLPASP